MSSSELETRLRRLTLAFRFVFWPFVLLFLIFGIPLVGNAVFIFLAEELGCAGSGGGPKPCVIHERDIGELYYGYSANLLSLGLTNPILFLALLHKVLGGKILTLWISSILILFLSARGVKNDLRQQA